MSLRLFEQLTMLQTGDQLARQHAMRAVQAELSALVPRTIPASDRGDVVTDALLRVINALAPGGPPKEWPRGDAGARSYLRKALGSAWLDILKHRRGLTPDDLETLDSVPAPSPEPEAPEPDWTPAIRLLDRVARAAIEVMIRRSDARDRFRAHWPEFLRVYAGLAERAGNDQEQDFTRLRREYIVPYLEERSDLSEDEVQLVLRLLTRCFTGRPQVSAGFRAAVETVLSEFGRGAS